MNVSINKYNKEHISQLRNVQTNNPKYYLEIHKSNKR